MSSGSSGSSVGPENIFYSISLESENVFRKKIILDSLVAPKSRKYRRVSRKTFPHQNEESRISLGLS